jgi:hypothetical protein
MAELFNFFPQFLVDGGQLFVERLQLLLAGFEFLAGRAQFLIDRL